jgi:hypothetical protein
MAEARKCDVCRVYQVCLGLKIRCICEDLNSRGYFVLVDEELNLLEVHQAGELQDYFLWVHTKPLTLPAY